MASSTPPQGQQAASPEDISLTRADTDSSGESPNSAPRRRERNDELRTLFKLPSTECLVDDYICALQKNMLHQGRLHIFEHFACFYSRIFNYQKLLVIPLKEVTQIKKRKHYGFPNSIEIAWRGKKEFFTSFLKRDNAHKLLCYAWSKSTPYAKLFGGVEQGTQSSPTGISPRTSPTNDSKKLLGSSKLAKLVHRPPSTHPLSWDNTDASIEPEENHPTGRAALEHPSVSEASHRYSDSDDESDLTGEGLDVWTPVSTSPPPVDSNMTLLVETEFDISVREFYKEFLLDQSQFFITWHEARGDTKVQLSEWRKHAVGYVRELTFITPLKQRIGPSKSLCNQTQRTRLHPNNHLIFETSQIMLDIPYGDHFSVEARWDITPIDMDKRCKVQVYLAIPFSKRTIFKSTIEGSTKQLMTDACKDWIATAKRWLEPPIPIAGVLSAFSNGPENSEDSETYHQPTHLSRSQSLALRLSSDLSRLPDVDLLQKAPTAHRSEIARVLQLRRQETEKQAGSHLNPDRSRSKSVSFASGPASGKQWTNRISQHPILGILLLVIVAQAAILLWQRHSGQPSAYSVRAFFPGDTYGWLNPLSRKSRQGPPSPDLAAIQQQLERLQMSFWDLQAQVSALHAKVKGSGSELLQE